MMKVEFCTTTSSISKTNRAKEHHLQTETIQNAFIAFLLDWIHIGDCHFALTPSSVDLNRSEQILQSFVKLLKTHYKEEHETAFYASRLSLTSHHLNWVIKRLTGHTVSELIYDLLYCEACILLNQSNHSIEEITDELQFFRCLGFFVNSSRDAQVSLHCNIGKDFKRDPYDTHSFE